jgi:WD40 repeat protein
MTSSDDGSLRVWNVESGKQIGEDWQGEGAGMNTIALSPDGKKVVRGSSDGAVRLWDIDTAKVIATWTGHTTAVLFLYWNGDGRRVVAGSYDGIIRVWDVETGETILRVGPLELTNMHTAVYSPDKTMIATGGRASDIGFIKIFDPNTGKLVKNLEPTVSEVVYSLTWPEDGKTLISGSDNGKIKIWNTTTWHQIAVLTGHTSTVDDVAVSPNGRILASASWGPGGTMRLWNLENGEPISSPIQSDNGVHCVSFSADGKLLATGCCDGNAYTWDVSAIVKEAGLDQLLSNRHVGFAFSL